MGVEKSQGSRGGPGTQGQLGFAQGEAPSVGVKRRLLCFISASPLPRSLLWGFRSVRSDRMQVLYSVLSESVSCSVVFYSFAAPWTVAHQAPLSMGFSQQEYWNGLQFLLQGNVPNPRT